MSQRSIPSWFWLYKPPSPPSHLPGLFRIKPHFHWLQFMCSHWNQLIRTLTGLSQMGNDSSGSVEEAGLSSLSSLACWQCRGLEDAPVTLNYHHPCSTAAEAVHERWPLKPCWGRRRFSSCWMHKVTFEKWHGKVQNSFTHACPVPHTHPPSSSNVNRNCSYSCSDRTAIRLTASTLRRQIVPLKVSFNSR